MSPTKWIAFLALLGAAFGAGHMVGSSSPEHAAPELRTSPAPDPGNGETPGTVLRGSPGPTLAVSSAGDSESAPFERALAELPPLDIPRGEGRIDVTVKTEDGAGVQGVRVTCRPQMPAGLVGQRAEDGEVADPAQALLNLANRLRWNEQAPRMAVTDASGSCSFEGLANVKHSLAVKAPGWHIYPPHRGFQEFDPGATVAYKAKPRTCVRVEVLMPDGSAPATARVLFGNGGRPRPFPWRQDSPELDVDAGTYEVTATSSDGHRYRSQSEQVTVQIGQPPPAVQLHLVERTALKVTVLPADGDAPIPIGLRHARVPSDADPDPALLAAVRHPRLLRPRAGFPMAFTLTDVEPGTWLVGAYRGEEGPLLASQVVEVKSGRNETTLKMPPALRSDYALLNVRGPDGLPLDELKFRTAFQTGTSFVSTPLAAVAKVASGAYRVFHLGQSTMGAKGICHILIEHRELGSRALSYPAGLAPMLGVRFSEPASVEVVLEGVEGDRYDGRFSVSLAPDTWWTEVQARGPAQADVGEKGRAAFSRLQLGAHLLALRVARGHYSNTFLVEENVEVREGSQTIRLRVPTLYVVEIEGLTAQAHIHRMDTDAVKWSQLVVVPGPQGRAIVDGLVAGEYQLQMGAKRTTFRLPGTSKVRIE